MAIGKVQSIDPANSQFGTVIEDETNDVYNYDDPDFKSKGLEIGSPCTFDLDYSQMVPVATNLQAYVATEKVISGPVSGPLTVNSGETLKVIKGGVVTGTVNLPNNGMLIVEDSGQINGNVTIDQGSNARVRKGGVITGNVGINNGSYLKIVNKGVIKGNIGFNSGNKLIIGNDNGGGFVTGSIITDKIRKLSITSTSVINCG